MFYSLNGTLVHIDDTFVVLDCNGVGYRCFTTDITKNNLPQVGNQVKLFTYLNVREDSMTIFGFLSQQELSCFKLLMSVSGVGSRVALAILSVLSYEQVALAITKQDSATFTLASGVGKKLAQRIILELKDKISKLNIESNLKSDTNIIGSSNKLEAINALTVLGYSRSEVLSTIASLDDNLTVEALIRQALKKFSGGI